MFDSNLNEHTIFYGKVSIIINIFLQSPEDKATQNKLCCGIKTKNSPFIHSWVEPSI